LLRSSTPIPGASEALKYLRSQQIPFILLTNGGGKLEAKRASAISEKLGIDISEKAIVQSHTPLKGLVDGTLDTKKKALRKGLVLVIGGHPKQVKEVAQR
jgi:ribonucleotide monophosphatase NagD (HAD superfamily)